MTAFEARASQAGQIGKVGFPPCAAIRGPSRSSTVLDLKPNGSNRTLNRHSCLRQPMVGSTRKRTFAPDFSGRGGFAGTSLGESIKPGGDRCISVLANI